jgi:uncharacterized membrane protein
MSPLQAEDADYTAVQAFADSLYHSNDFSSSVLEYKRINFMNPDNPQFDENRFRIVQSLYYLGDYQNVIKELDGDKLILANYPHAAYLYARSLSNIDLIDISNQYIMKNPDAGNIQNMRYLLMLNYLRQDKLDMARSILDNDSSQFVDDKYLHHQFEEYERRLSKSRVLPNVMNIVPGMGYLPIKNYQNALSTFLTTSFMYLIAGELYKEGLEFAGTFFLSAGVIFHMGSFVGMNRFNDRLESKYRDDLIKYIELKTP